MKVQITVDDEVWKKAKASAALRGETLGEWVGVALGNMIRHLTVADKREVVEVDTRGRAPGERARRAVEAEAPKPVQVSNPALPTTLKEGYGWCCACKVKQVKLPGMLCSSCAKPT